MQSVPIDAALPQSGGDPAGGDTETERISFGQYLTRAREAKSLSLDDVAHLTKIRRAILEALEHNARRDLPEKVFVLGYVRSYASSVGLNVDEAVQRCSSTWDDGEKSSTGEEEAKASRSYGWVWPTPASMGAAGAIWFIIHLQ